MIYQLIVSVYFLVLIITAVIDYFTYLIPNPCVIAVLGCGMMRFCLLGINGSELITGSIVVLLCFAIYISDKGKQIGGGDLKLIGASSFVLSFPVLFFGLLIGCILAIGVEGFRSLMNEKCSVFPMVPYLAAGLLISYVVK